MAKILLLRHGQSEWNVLGKWQGSGANPELTEEGRDQAKHAATYLTNIKKVYSSPLTRAYDTAKIICDYLEIDPPEIANDLIERDAGEWTGLTRAQIEDKWPNFLEEGKRPDTFESSESLIQRALNQILDIVNKNDELTCCVTHAGVIGRIIDFINSTQHSNELQRVSNCQGWWLDVDPETQEILIYDFFAGDSFVESDKEAL